MDNATAKISEEQIDRLYEFVQELRNRLKADIDRMNSKELMMLYKLKSCLMGGRHE